MSENNGDSPATRQNDKGKIMEIVKFVNKTFHQIPEQDNPAFGKTECVMICKKDASPTDERLSILHIVPDPTESVNRVAIVWDEKNAALFANALVAMLKEGE